MDLRVLKYFLAVAREGNITRAAAKLHITQPTLSRQLMELERELNTVLLERTSKAVTLTPTGLLFQQRAGEILSLLDKTERELTEYENLVGGVVSIGCVESSASFMLPEALEAFGGQYPAVRYEIFSGNGDDLRYMLDQGTLDMGVLLEPVEAAKYSFTKLRYEDVWGLVMRADDPLAQREELTAADVVPLPLILSRRGIVQEQIAEWLGVDLEQLHIYATHNLGGNTALLAERGLGYALCVQGAYLLRRNENLRFVPIVPRRTTGHVLAWKKNRVFSPAASLFMDFICHTFQA